MDPLFETDHGEDYVCSWSGTIEGIPTNYRNTGGSQATQVLVCPDPLVGVFIGARGHNTPMEFNVFTPTFSADSPPHLLYTFHLPKCLGTASCAAFTCPLTRDGRPALVVACGLDRDLHLVDIFERKHCGRLMWDEDLGYPCAVASKDSLVAVAGRLGYETETSLSIVLLQYQDGKWTRIRNIAPRPYFEGWFPASLTIRQTAPYPQLAFVTRRVYDLVTVRVPAEHFQQFVATASSLEEGHEVVWMHLSSTVRVFIERNAYGFTTTIANWDHKPTQEFFDTIVGDFGGATSLPRGGVLIVNNTGEKCPQQFDLLTTAREARMAHMSALRVAWIGVVVRGVWRRKLQAAAAAPRPPHRRTRSRHHAP